MRNKTTIAELIQIATELMHESVHSQLDVNISFNKRGLKDDSTSIDIVFFKDDACSYIMMHTFLSLKHNINIRNLVSQTMRDASKFEEIKSKR